MKRSEFLRKLGIGLGVAVVAPQILANIPKEEEIKPLVGDTYHVMTSDEQFEEIRKFRNYFDEQNTKWLHEYFSKAGKPPLKLIL